MAIASRRLVLCLDGTWQNPYKARKRDDGSRVLKPSNVLKLSRAVLTADPSDGRAQITFYDSGIGAQVLYPGLANRILTFLDSKLGGAWGAGFESNVEEAFRFLVHNYQPGDQVFLFGFSRGAAQARALTRFLDWLGGIPSKRDAYFAPLFFRSYIVSRGTASPDSVRTAGGHGPSEPLVPIRIELLGVWDTVMALGSRFRACEGTSTRDRSFHVGPEPARCVLNARQALAIDESRYDFRPEVWRDHHEGQSLEQRWFAGCHANIGGGYVEDGLANVPFRWMLREARTHGLAIDPRFIKPYRAYPQGRLYDSRSGAFILMEAVRFRLGQGRRPLTGYADTANLGLDPAVIHRLRSDPADHDQLELYRPHNLLRYLAAQPDLGACLAELGFAGGPSILPGDVLDEIEMQRHDVRSRNERKASAPRSSSANGMNSSPGSWLPEREDEYAMRGRFPWGQDLTAQEFGLALLVLGLLPPGLARRTALPGPGELVDLLLAHRRRYGEGPWAWRLRPAIQHLLDGDAAPRTLVEAAPILVSRAEGVPGLLRLEINPTPDLDPIALAVVLQRAGAHSAYIRCRDEGDTTWSWPLRLAADTDSGLLDGLHHTDGLERLYRSFDLGSLPLRVNITFVSASLAALCARLEASGRRPLTDAVVLFGEIGAPAEEVDGLVARLRRLSGSQAIVLIETRDDVRARQLVPDLIVALSHDQPLDAAAGTVARNLDLPVLIWAARGLIAASSVRQQGRELAHRLRKMEAWIPLRRSTVERIMRASAEEEADEAERGAGDLAGDETGGLRIRARELGEELARRLPMSAPVEGGEPPPDAMDFECETEGADAIADLAESMVGASAEDRRARERRYLQTRVQTPAGHPVLPDMPLRPGRPYKACVFIGAPRDSWLGLGQPLREPPPKPDGSPLTLQVMFWEPVLEKGPQILPLLLYPEGDTSVVVFPFTAPREPRLFSARIAVYHRNRVLQTGVLKGMVGQVASKLTFQPDATPLPRFVGLEDRAAVGASIILNDDPDGNMQAYVHGDGETAVAVIGDEPVSAGGAPDLAVGIDAGQAGALEQLTTALGRNIGRIAQNPDDYADLGKEGTRTLLLELAQHGGALLGRLQLHSGMGHLLDRAEHIQIVRAKLDAFFPAEFLYTGEIPEDDAQICSCLADPTSIATDGRCAEYDADPEHTICPMKFWSMSKIIERHAHLPEHVALDHQFMLRSSPASERERVLDPLAGAVLAASDKVDEAVPNTLASLKERLETLLQRDIPVAVDWDDWAVKIAENSPHLLVLLPHHSRSSDVDYLEIGAGIQRKALLIKSRHVHPDAHPETNPVVLLIGCQTQETKIDLEGFVPAFQDAGAAIVVSTIATILGRQAGPAAGVIVEELRRIRDRRDATFGQAMLAARRRLLATGTPMILGLTSYGDADWRIVSAPDGDPVH
jgi:uncharacterized protein (DUF2235 family)